MGGAFFRQLAVVSPASAGLFLLSLAYPVAVLSGAACLLGAKAREQRNLPFWFAAAFIAVHLLIAGYLAKFGTIGMRTWT